MTKLAIYTDGGARGNPGPAAIGIAIYDDSGKLLKKIGQVIGSTTNNQAEYKALLVGLQTALDLGATEASAFLDSELVVRQLLGQYKVREESLKEPMMAVLRLVNKFQKVTFTHVPREKNQLADELVNQALDASE